LTPDLAERQIVERLSLGRCGEIHAPFQAGIWSAPTASWSMSMSVLQWIVLGLVSLFPAG